MSKFSICPLCYPKKQALFCDDVKAKVKDRAFLCPTHGVIDLSKFKHNVALTDEGLHDVCLQNNQFAN